MTQGTAKTVNILGIRGIPAAHGGFETFAANLAPYLRDRGWTVNVYCQLEPDEHGELRPDYEDDWNGIHRIHYGAKSTGSVGSIKFDWRCIKDASKRTGVNLVLGYNTAIFSLLLRLRGKPVVMNMDGVEWRRDKWSWPIKAWFYANEFVGANIATVPIADHPEIARHLHRHLCYRAHVIPYGADEIVAASVEPILKYKLLPEDYYVSIARIEPENSILEIVKAYSRKARRSKLVVLGKLVEGQPYHDEVRRAASDQVLFLGAIYDSTIVSSLRYHALAYLHGHQVGGTNPSLVEALAAGNAVIAHANRFNRWVAGEDQIYFADESELASYFDQFDSEQLHLHKAQMSSRQRYRKAFTLQNVHQQYEAVLMESSR